LRLAASAELFSEHPVGKAIVEFAQSRNVAIVEPQSFNNEPGLGVVAEIDGTRIAVGSAELVVRHGVMSQQRNVDGQTAVYIVRRDGEAPALLGAITLADEIKPDSHHAIRELHDLGLRTVLLTGDNESTARKIANEAGINDVRANVRPEGKAAVVRALQQQSEANEKDTREAVGVVGPWRVAMVGDGINDAPALAQADLGIAIGSGSDIAKEAGGIVLVGSSLSGVAASIRLSRATMRTIRQNLFLAFVYNVLAIPLAALGFLNPLIAAAAMALSDVTVIGNALRLRRAPIDGVLKESKYAESKSTTSS